MSKWLIIVVTLSMAALGMGALSGCAALGRAPVTGIFYSDLQDGITATYSQRPAKRGEACATSILGLVATGDASINTARTNGNINAVSSVDYSTSNILGVYAKYCIIVRGN
jgi:hypothetical protein